MTFFFTEDDITKQYRNDVLYILKYFQSQILNLTDTRIYFLLTGWKRVLKKLAKDGQSLINEIYTVLRKVLEQAF